MTISDTAQRHEPVRDRARPPRPSSKPNGQWKIDGTAALNGNEQWKQEDGGLAVRERIENVYAAGGFASIDPTDLHGRFRWWGLYTQRKPGIDGISHEFGRDTADITDRQNIQLHWIRVEDVPEIWRRLEAVGLQTTEACGDVPRVILGSPVAGIADDELIDPTPAIEEITRRFIGDESLANLPRKFKTAITGHPSQDVVHEINDVAFIAAEHPTLGIGYDLWVGGALSTTPRLGERLNAFVAAEQVPDVWHGVAQIFRDYGYRRLRNKARLKFLLAEWGAERFLAELGLQVRPSLIRRGTIACTGIEFCKLAIVETKVNAGRAVEELEERLAGIELPHPISLHVNGCPNSCARIQTADIGLKGQLITDEHGEQVPGYQVHLGGGLASQDRDEPGLGRTVRGLKVAADGIADYAERVLRRFVAERDAAADETFAQWAHRVDEEALQ